MYSTAKFVPATSMKTTTVHCVTGANGSIDRASVEKPAVATTARPAAVALKGVMRGSIPVAPKKPRTTMATAVRPR